MDRAILSTITRNRLSATDLSLLFALFIRKVCQILVSLSQDASQHREQIQQTLAEAVKSQDP
eukprot:2944294-Amphidinium_carterae.1